MSRVCSVSLKRPLSGNNVSHAHNKTKCFFKPNLRWAKVWSPILLRWIDLRLSASGLRTLDKHGGLDAYLTKTPLRRLSKELLALRKAIKTKQS